MLLTADEIEEISKNLNAFQKFLQELPDKALVLGIRVLLAVVFFFYWHESHFIHPENFKKIITKSRC